MLNTIKPSHHFIVIGGSSKPAIVDDCKSSIRLNKSNVKQLVIRAIAKNRSWRITKSALLISNYALEKKMAQ